MNRRMVFWSLLATLAALLGRVDPQEARAMATSEAPLKLEVWVPQETLALGEPLVLHYRISNLAQEELVVELWGDADRFPVWLKGTTLRTPGRPPISLATRISRVDYGGGIYVPGVRIAPGQQYDGREVLAQWTPPLEAGRVDLHLVMQLPADAIGKEPAARGVLKVRKEIRLVVAGRDPARLRALSRSLLKTIYQDPEEPEDADLDLLLALPAEDAGDAWRSLARDRTTDRYLRSGFVKSLGRRDSVTAADILAELAWGTTADPGSRDADLADLARDNLLNLCRKASPAVKERARQHFLTHEGAVPRQRTD